MGLGIDFGQVLHTLEARCQSLTVTPGLRRDDHCESLTRLVG